MSAVYRPAVTSVTITPNPAAINGSITVSATVSDVRVTMYAVSAVCGSAICGGAITLSIRKEEVSE